MFPLPVGRNRLTNKLQNENIYGISYICSRERELLPWRHGITFFNKVLIPEVIKLTAIVQINFKMLIIHIQICAVIECLEYYSKHILCP